MEMIGKDHNCVDHEWMPGTNFAKGAAQDIDMIGEEPETAILDIHGEEIFTARDKITAVIGH